MTDNTLSLGRLYKLTFLVALVAIVFDQATKLWVRLDLMQVCAKPIVEIWRAKGDNLGCAEFIQVLPFFNIRFSLNPGVSFSQFSSSGELGRWILVGVIVLVVIAFLWFLRREPRRLYAIGIGLIIGGAIANGIDRVYIGAVVDFIDIHFFGIHPFVFNVADAAITFGVICLLIDTFFLQSDD